MKKDRFDDDTVSFFVTLMHALAHPTRLRIVELLTGESCTVGEVADALDLLQPNASQHLAVLSRAGVVKVVQEGTARRCSLRGPRITRILELVSEFQQVHAADLNNLPIDPHE